MGCDIHLYLERKAEVRGETKWVGLGEIRSAASNRNYALFARLAGVRGDGPEAKGMPEDASDLSVMAAEDYGDDWHSHSYCSLKEFLVTYVKTTMPEQVTVMAAELLENKSDVLDKLARDLFDLWDVFDKEYWGSTGKHPPEFRCVFWFDN
jgi:hypothetical protein